MSLAVIGLSEALLAGQNKSTQSKSHFPLNALSEKLKSLDRYALDTKDRTDLTRPRELDNKVQKGGQAKASSTEKTIVNDIIFKIEKEGVEKVFIKFSNYIIPRIYAMDGGKPRIVIDIKDVSSWSGRSKITVNGKLIKQIRTHLHRKSKMLRIVLDLFKFSKDYQTYYESRNTYCVEIKDNSLNALPKVLVKKTREVKKAKSVVIKKTTVESINFKIEKEGIEKVFIEFNRYVVPETFALEGNIPRLVINVKNVYSWNGRPRIPLNGKLVKQIRTYLNRESKTLRIVLDLLKVSKEYTVSQTYYKANNLYCVEVRDDSSHVLQEPDTLSDPPF